SRAFRFPEALARRVLAPATLNELVRHGLTVPAVHHSHLVGTDERVSPGETHVQVEVLAVQQITRVAADLQQHVAACNHRAGLCYTACNGWPERIDHDIRGQVCVPYAILVPEGAHE